LLSFPPGTEMFHFPGFATLASRPRPIRASRDQSLVAGSPGLIAGSHALHRLLVPSHPPRALSSLTTTVLCPPSFPLGSRRNRAARYHNAEALQAAFPGHSPVTTVASSDTQIFWMPPPRPHHLAKELTHRPGVAPDGRSSSSSDRHEHRNLRTSPQACQQAPDFNRNPTVLGSWSHWR
jgi:hypothetical protein